MKTNAAHEAGVDESAVDVAVEAASVKVTVTIATASVAQATSVRSSLSASLANASAATSVLGVPVSSTPSVASGGATTTIVIEINSGDDDDDGSAAQGLTVGIFVGIGAAMLVGGLLLGVLVVGCFFPHRLPCRAPAAPAASAAAVHAATLRAEKSWQDMTLQGFHPQKGFEPQLKEVVVSDSF